MATGRARAWPCPALYGWQGRGSRKRHGRLELQQVSTGRARERGLARKGIGRMMRGTRTGRGALRDGWARPNEARSCPMLPRSSESYRAVTAIVRNGMLSWHQSRLPGVSGRQATAQSCSECHRRPTVPYHSPFPDRWLGRATAGHSRAWRMRRVESRQSTEEGLRRRSGAESSSDCGPIGRRLH